MRFDPSSKRHPERGPPIKVTVYLRKDVREAALDWCAEHERSFSWLLDSILAATFKVER